MEMCFIHMFNYAEFKTINMFLKEKTLKITAVTLAAQVFKMYLNVYSFNQTICVI